MAKKNGYDVKIAKLEVEFENLGKQVDIINTSLFGDKGIKSKIDRMIGGLSAFKYIGGGGGFAGIIALVITIINMVVH